MTFPRFDNDLLIAWASVNLNPSLPLSLTRSLPARSTKLRVLIHFSWVATLFPSIRNRNTECDLQIVMDNNESTCFKHYLLDRSLHNVFAHDRLFLALLIILFICSSFTTYQNLRKRRSNWQFTSSTFRFVTIMSLLSFILISCFTFASVTSRSLISSL